MKYPPPSFGLNFGCLPAFLTLALTLLLTLPAWAGKPARPPAAPTSLTATAQSYSAIKLDWVDNASNESGYYVDRSPTSGGTYTRIATLGVNTRSYTNISLTAGTPYYYRVLAYNTGGSSAAATASATTLLAPADTTFPTVSLSAPANGSTVSGTISVSANASDNVGVTRVEFYRGGTTLIGTDTSAPYSVSFDTTTVINGSLSLTAKAFDAANNVTTSAAFSVTVNNTTPDTTFPTVSLSAPANGSTVSGTISVSANASDNVGVTRVEFYRGGTTLIGTDTSAPYSVSFDTTTVINGSLSLTAKAFDAANNVTTSAAFSVTVNNTTPDTTFPTVSLSAPANGSTVSGTISVSANASDNVGVTRVEFYRGGTTLIGTDTSAPYSVSFDTTTVINGSLSLTAKAFDAANNVTTSAAFSVTVNNTTPDTTFPTVSLSAPANGSTVSGTISVSANASDNVGVTRVEFYRGGTTLIGTDTSAPYSVSFDTTTVINGSLSLTAKALDAANNVTTSAAFSVTVNNTTPDTTFPTVSLSAPANGSTVSGTISVSANASDNVGVTRVEFYRGGTTLIGTDTSAPYSVSFDTTTVINGSLSLTAKAFDAANNVTTSAAFSVTVNNTTPDTTFPTVSLSAPANGSTVSGTISVSANASDNVGVTRVEFYRGGTTLIGTDTSAPYSVSFDTTTVINGSLSLTAKALDAANNVTTSAAFSVTVNNTTPDTTAPTVTMTAPSGGSTISGNVTLTAAASDNVGVSRVEYWCDDTTLCATATAAPFSATDDTTEMSNGTHIYKAKAYDAAGNSSTSAGTTVTVNNTTVDPSTWAQSIGGVGGDVGRTVVVDASGNIYVAGTFSGSFTFVTTPLTSAGGRDLFLAKFNSAGALQWVRSYGSTGDEVPQQIVVGPSGNIYLGGMFMTTASFGGSATPSAGASDGFIAKYTSTGTYVWSRTLGGTGTDQINGIALDSTESKVVAIGMFTGTVTFTPTSTFTSQSQGNDSFLAGYATADGAPMWAKTWGSLDYDTGLGVFCDPNDNLTVFGCFAYKLGSDMGSIMSYVGTRDLYIGKFAAPGSAAPGVAIWSKSYGSVNNTTPYCAALDKNGDLTVGGTFVSQTDLGKGTVTGTGSYSAFLAKYSGASGAALWSRGVSSSWSVMPNKVAFDASNNPILCGTYTATCNFGAQTFTEVGTSSSGDAFVAKYNGTSGNPVWAESFGGAAGDSAMAIGVDGGNYSTVVGYFSGSANYGVPLNSAGGTDIFVLRLDP